MNLNLRKYLIMGSQNTNRRPEIILEEAAKSGITAFQFREKGPGSLSGEAKKELGCTLRDICFKYNVLFFVNDNIDLIDPLQADGIHIGQEDEQLKCIRYKFPDRYIGLSVSNQMEVSSSSIHLADYLGAGPMFPTSSKADAKQAVGTTWIKLLKQQFPDMPIVGIGGITETNASSVMNAGADGVAVISAITKASNVSKAVRNL